MKYGSATADRPTYLRVDKSKAKKVLSRPGCLRAPIFTAVRCVEHGAVTAGDPALSAQKPDLEQGVARGTRLDLPS